MTAKSIYFGELKDLKYMPNRVNIYIYLSRRYFSFTEFLISNYPIGYYELYILILSGDKLFKQIYNLKTTILLFLICKQLSIGS